MTPAPFVPPPVQIGAGETMMNQALINIYTMLAKFPPNTAE